MVFIMQGGSLIAQPFTDRLIAIEISLTCLSDQPSFTARRMIELGANTYKFAVRSTSRPRQNENDQPATDLASKKYMVVVADGGYQNIKIFIQHKQ